MFLACLLLCCAFAVSEAEGSPPKCKDGKFLDVQNQIYIGCDECEKNWMDCKTCCSNPATRSPNSSPDTPIASVEDPATRDRQVLQAFLYGFVLFIIASVLLVLVVVVVKVTRERRAQCNLESRDRNSSSATEICEVCFSDDTTNTVDARSNGCHSNEKDLPSAAYNMAVSCESFDRLSSCEKAQISRL